MKKALCQGKIDTAESPPYARGSVQHVARISLTLIRQKTTQGDLFHELKSRIKKQREEEEEESESPPQD